MEVELDDLPSSQLAVPIYRCPRGDRLNSHGFGFREGWGGVGVGVGVVLIGWHCAN